ncbi:MAG TPA: carbon-nitrogen hydrolase family protein [Ilumatobacteraceae bacterium]|nr:carbon-nitrogen hydrolase family protein [Ilumatobacteraceae bacterium]
MTSGSFRIAAVQAAPVFGNAMASAAKACELIAEAASLGVSIAAFSETWLPGYCRFVNAPLGASEKRHLQATYIESAIDVPGPETDQLCSAARDAGIDVVIGVVERDSLTHGSVYCALVFISSDGEIVGKHRKLKPTYAERTAWAEGDGSGLRAIQRPYARISGLNCWEHNMVLPAYALMADGTQVHVAAFPGYETKPPARSSGTRQLLLSRAFASQAAAYTILAGGVLRPSDVADAEMREAVAMLPPLTGDSYIIDPFGDVIAGPIEGEGILVAEASLDHVREAKATCDVAGHYSRPDILQLVVNRQPAARVIERS